MKKTIWYMGMLWCCILLLAGCGLTSTESVKIRDLEYTLLTEQVIPAQLYELIKAKGDEPFQFTYRDKDYLYISIGYGMQKTGGHRIVVEELYLTEAAIYVSTLLLGPESKEETQPHNPVIVIKTENLEEQVIYK